jgi:hypothetical protein
MWAALKFLTPALIKLPFAGSNLDGSEVIVTLGNYSPTATDVLIILNKTIAAATTITLPSVLGRSGVPLIIVDFGGNAGDVTINPFSGETIMGLSSATLTSSGQGVGSGAVIILQPISTLLGWVQI